MHLSNEREAKVKMNSKQQQANATAGLINKIIENNPTANIVFEVDQDHKLVSCLGIDDEGKVVTNRSQEFMDMNPDRYIVHVAKFEEEITLKDKGALSTGEAFLYLVAGAIVGIVTTYAIIR